MKTFMTVFLAIAAIGFFSAEDLHAAGSWLSAFQNVTVPTPDSQSDTSGQDADSTTGNALSGNNAINSLFGFGTFRFPTPIERLEFGSQTDPAEQPQEDESQGGTDEAVGSTSRPISAFSAFNQLDSIFSSLDETAQSGGITERTSFSGIVDGKPVNETTETFTPFTDYDTASSSVMETPTEQGGGVVLGAIAYAPGAVTGTPNANISGNSNVPYYVNLAFSGNEDTVGVEGSVNNADTGGQYMQVDIGFSGEYPKE